MNSSEFLLSSMGGIEEDFLMEANEYSPKTKKPRRPFRILLIAAAAAVLLTGAVMAAAALWSPKLAALFGAPPETQKALSASGFIQDIGVSASDGGVTVTAEQLIGDANGVYILYSIRADDPDLLSAWTFPHYTLTLDGESRGRGRRDWAEAGNLYDVEAQRSDDGTLYFFDLLMAEDGETFSGKEASVHVDYIDDMTTEVDGKFPIIWEGDIELTWTIDYTPSENTAFAVNEPIPYQDADVFIESIEVSAIGIRTICTGIPVETNYYEGAGTVTSIPDTYAELAHALQFPVSVTLSDGSVCELTRNDVGAAQDYPEDGKVEFISLFAGQVFRAEAFPVSICYEIGGEIITVSLS